MTTRSGSDRGVLVVPTLTTPTVEALSTAAFARGFDVLPIGVADLLPTPAPEPLHFFGGPRLAEHVQRLVPLALLEPTDAWLAHLPKQYLRREVRLMPALEAYGLRDECFMKMPREKDMEPGVYRGHELPTLSADEPLLVSEVVRMTDEWRFWILDGHVHAASSYRIRGYPDARPLSGDEPALQDFMDDLLADQADRLPSAVVIDVAWVDADEPGWAIVEANMAWFSSHYAAYPDRVLDVVLRAAGPPEALGERDATFCTQTAR